MDEDGLTVLPVEMWRDIADRLGPIDTVMLRLACRYARDAVPPVPNPLRALASTMPCHHTHPPTHSPICPTVYCCDALLTDFLYICCLDVYDIPLPSVYAVGADRRYGTIVLNGTDGCPSGSRRAVSAIAREFGWPIDLSRLP